jgi:uncharacterized membrane-anchored protein
MSAGSHARGRQQAVGLVGPARVAADAATVAARVRPGDIAVIDHLDLDRSSAEALVAARPAAVLNAARSISGRYPNLGPQVLVAAGVPLVDDLGPDVLSVPDGHPLRVADGAVYDGEALLAEGDVQTPASVAEAMAGARDGLATQLQAFAANGMAYLRDEQGLLLEGEGVPQLATTIAGRPVLVVVAGAATAGELAAVRPFVREHRPVLVGVDGGADLLLAAGLRPDIVLGALDQVSERALTGGAELVVLVPRTGETPGVPRLRRLDLAFVTYHAGGAAADAALLLADARGADLVVGVGTRAGLLDLVDAGRESMAGTVLTRLRVGATLLDAGAVARLYRHRISTWQVLLLVVAALVALGVALAVTPAGQDLYAALGARLADFAGWVRGLVEGS